jgi:hypothetical protein
MKVICAWFVLKRKFFFFLFGDIAKATVSSMLGTTPGFSTPAKIADSNSFKAARGGTLYDVLLLPRTRPHSVNVFTNSHIVFPTIAVIDKID